MTTTPTTNMLEEIFSIQEHVMSGYIEKYPKRYAYLQKCVDALGSPNYKPQIWDTIPVIHRAVYKYFSGDALSTLINAIRLCLQGCETDAFALMRVIVENLTILEYVINFSLFDEIYLEIEEAPREKKFSSKFRFHNAKKMLEVNDRRSKFTGRLSNIGSHTSPPRLARSRFTIDDISRAKIGMSLNNPHIVFALGELMSIALFIIIITDIFLTSQLGNPDINFHPKRQDLEEEYASLQRKIGLHDSKE